MYNLPEMKPYSGSPLSFNLNYVINLVVGLLNIQLPLDYPSGFMPFYADPYTPRIPIIFYPKSSRSNLSLPSQTNKPSLTLITQSS